MAMVDFQALNGLDNAPHYGGTLPGNQCIVYTGDIPAACSHTQHIDETMSSHQVGNLPGFRQTSVACSSQQQHVVKDTSPLPTFLRIERDLCQRRFAISSVFMECHEYELSVDV